MPKLPSHSFIFFTRFTPQEPSIMAVMEVHNTPGLIPWTSSPRHVSYQRMAFNVLAALVFLPLIWIAKDHCRWPMTLDAILTVFLTELTRYVNEGRRMAYHDGGCASPVMKEKVDADKMDPETRAFSDVDSVSSSSMARLDIMAAVVGWREDPALYARALESYRRARGCVFLIAGIDGDEKQDQDMVDVFNMVYPDNSATIHVAEPLGEVAESIRVKEIATRRRQGLQIVDSEIDKVATSYCIHLAREALTKADITFGGPEAVTQLCIRQRHLHKKGIMFTTYIFSLVIADILGVEFLWSSDSDTLVMEDSLSRSADIIAADPTIGGASSGLVVHNGDETTVTKLAETVYWGELYLTRSLPAATATSDCQSGPSTIFRLAALPPILVPWYLQTLWGKRMIINEDRHLTTNLLKRGWGVVFASDVLTATDTPTTLARWLRQQVRWARATHIESLLQPKVYLVSHPLLFYSMLKREFGPLLAAAAVVWYFLTSRNIILILPRDLLVRCVVSLIYNILRNPHRLERRSWKWVVPGVAFFHVPVPAVHVWSLLTLTADGWGTSMRAEGEIAKRDSLRQAWFETGFFVVWMGVVAGCLARWTAAHVLGLERGATALLFVGSVVAASYAAWRGTVAKTI